MKFLILLLNVLGFWLMADAAHADPISLAITAIAQAIGSIGSIGIIGKLVLTVALNVGLSLIEKAMAKKDQPQPAGTKLEVSMGDDHPMSFVIGSYATAGKRKYAGTWGDDGKTPNAYFTDVLEIGSVPNYAGERGLTSVWIDDQQVGVLWEEPHPDGRGFPVLQYRVDGKDYLWIKFLDGTQTSADAFLMTQFGANADRPWKPTMIGRGCQVVILTARYNSDLFSGIPAGLYQPHPIPLYDVRKDSSAGGNGIHRWDNPASWEPSSNPAIMIYNLARGVYYGQEWVCGGQNIAAFCLPAANWMAAANACDAGVTLDDGSAEPAFRAGYEVPCDQQPLDVISELLKGCNGRMAEVGGIFKVLISAPGGAVYSFSDDDIVVTEEQDFQPFPSLSDTYNAIEATYPEPTEKWATKDAPGRYNADLEVQDGNRRLPAQIQLPAVPFANQVQRVGLAMIQDYRRFRVHQIALPPDAYPLEPNDVVSWTSARNGYDEKKFLVVKVEPQPNFLIVVTLKEVDPADYDWHSGLQLPIATGWIGPIAPPSQPMVGWTVEPATVKDAGGIDRRPAIKISCAPDMDDVERVWVQVRLKETGDIVFDSDSTRYASPFSWVLSGQWTLSNTDYEARGRYIPKSNRATDWSAWLAVKTPNVLIQSGDVLDGAIIASKIADAAVTAEKIMDEAVSNLKLADAAVSTAKIEVAAVTAQVLADQAVISSKLADAAVTAQKLASEAIDATKFASGIEPVGIASGASLPTTKSTTTIVWCGKLYRWDGTAYSAEVDAGDINGQISGAQIAAAAIDATRFAAGIEPVTIINGSTAPTVKSTSTIYVNGKLYRWNGSAYTTAVSSSDVTGQMIASQIADAAVTGSKLAAQAITNDKIAANAIYGTVIAADAISARELVLTDFSNIADNGWTSGTLAGWTVQQQQDFYLDNVSNGDANGWIYKSIGRDQAVSNRVAVNPGDTYCFDVWVYNTDASRANVMALLRRSDDITYTYPVVAFTDAKNAWVRLQGQCTVPAGYATLAMDLQTERTSGTGVFTLWSKPIMRRAASAQLIVDGAITANKIAASAVLADKIAANAITTGSIAAGAVNAAQIAAGAITADKLAVGSGSNFIPNSDFSAGLTGWHGEYSNSAGSFAVSYRTDTYAPPGGAMQITCTGNTQGIEYGVAPADPTINSTGFNPSVGGTGIDYYSCEAGQWFEFSGYYLGLYSNGIQPYMGFIDKNGLALAYPTAGVLPAAQNIDPQSNLANYQRFWFKAQAPAGAVKVVPFVRHKCTLPGQTVSYIFLTRLYFGEANANQTQPTPWSPAGLTMVSGGSILTGAITADKIAANTITAAQIAADSITGAQIAVGAISASEIAADAITAAKLASNSVTTDALAVGSGKNLLQNAGFTMGTDCWVISFTSGPIPSPIFRIRAVTETWAGPNCPTLMLSYGAPSGNNYYSDVQWLRPDAPTLPNSLKYGVPCAPGDWFEVSAYVSAHRCLVELRLQWIGSDGVPVGYTTANQNNGIAGSSTNPDLWTHLRCVGVAPANAIAVAIHIRKFETIAGQTDSYMFLNKPMLCRCPANASEFTPWSDGGVVMITNGGIVADAITADKIATNAVTADAIAANAVTAGKIAASAVTATTIAAATITGDKLAANTIGASQIAADAITAKQLVLTDFSNMADNGWQTGSIDGWTTQNKQNFYLDNGQGDASGYLLQSLGRDCAYSNFVAVSPGETYAFDVWVLNTDANLANVYAFARSPSGTVSPVLVTGTNTKNAWVRLQGKYTVPSGITALAMDLQVNKTAGAGSSCYWSRPVMRRAVSAELIVDGAVTANKISVNSLDALTANLGAVNISSAVIGSLTVGTSNIQGGACTEASSARTSGTITIGANGTVNMVACGVNVAGDGRVLIDAMSIAQYNQSGGGNPAAQAIGVNIFRDGLAIFSQTFYLPTVKSTVSTTGGSNGSTTTTNFSAGTINVNGLYDTPGAGFHTYTLQIFCPGNTIGWNESNISAVAYKR